MKIIKMCKAFTLSLILALTITSVKAAELNARDFLTAPVGTSLGVLYLNNENSDRFDGPADIENNASLDVNAAAFRQLWFSDFCGTLCTPQFIVPFAEVDARLPGSVRRDRQIGIGDVQVGGTLFFMNRPESRTSSGLLTLLTLPVGKYDSQRPGTSPGANRFAATFVYNYTQGIGNKWILEANLEGQFYGDNDDYLGMNLEQDPLYRIQAFASYDFSPKTYGALRLIHARGGELALENQTLENTRQGYTRVGFEVGYQVTPKNQVMVALTRNVDTENAFESTQALLRIAHVW